MQIIKIKIESESMYKKKSSNEHWDEKGYDTLFSSIVRRKYIIDKSHEYQISTHLHNGLKYWMMDGIPCWYWAKSVLSQK